jgi:hypothetical protein
MIGERSSGRVRWASRNYVSRGPVLRTPGRTSAEKGKR